MINQSQNAPLDFYRANYRELDPEEAARRTGLDFSPESSMFSLNALGYTIYAKWPDFELTPADSQNCPKVLYGFKMQILTLRYLLEGATVPASGVFKAYREMPWGELYDANFQGRCIKRFAYSFGFKPEVFAKAAEMLGGVKQNHGDIAYDLTMFDSIVCRMILWTPDDEFPPSAQILFSDNTQFVWNAEDLAVVGDVLIGALKECGNGSPATLVP